MATTLNISTNYAGEVAGKYIGKMIKASNTIQDGLVTILPNITGETTVRKITTSEGWTNYSCGFTPTGSITLSERSFTPKKIKFNEEICKEDFRQGWSRNEMGLSAHNDDIPGTEKDAILLEIAKNVVRKIDTEIWEGNGTTGVLAGFIPAFILDAGVVKVATPVAITSANVEAQVGKFIDTVPDFLIQDEKTKLLVSTNVIRALRKVYGQQARLNGTFLNPNSFEFDGYMLTEGKGLNSNTMVAYHPDNLFFGTGLLADHNDIRIKDMDESDLSGTIRINMVLTGGVQYANPDEIILYRA